MRPVFLAVTASVLALALPATAAGGLYDTTFAKTDRCYSRTYDKTHMKAHPRQTVSGMQVYYTAANADDTPNKPDAFLVAFSFQVKGSDEWFAGSATCKTLSDHFACSLEGDGGQFNLMPKAGGLSLAVVNQGGTDAKANQIRLEGNNGFSGFGKPGGDDLVFTVPKVANSVCDSGGY